MQVNIIRFLAGFFFLILIYGCGDVEVNRSINIPDNTIKNEDLTTVNGSITIGKNCEINGSCQTVNGNVYVGDKSIVRTIRSVNGAIEIGRDVQVVGELNAINGNISIKSGSIVEKDIEVINHSLDVSGAKIYADIIMKNGDIYLRRQTEVDGGVFVNTGTLLEVEGSLRQSVSIVLSERSIIHGDIEVGEQTTEARVIIKDDSQVKGNIYNADVMDQSK
jgi:hypothetical protein